MAPLTLSNGPIRGHFGHDGAQYPPELRQASATASSGGSALFSVSTSHEGQEATWQHGDTTTLNVSSIIGTMTLKLKVPIAPYVGKGACRGISTHRDRRRRRLTDTALAAP